MSYLRWTLSACIFVVLGLTSVNHADEPPVLPRAGVLVLRNGRVLRGDILCLGDRYVVGMNEQDEVTVPVDSVQWHCASFDEAYQRKRGQLPATAKVADHLELADWCLRYEMLAAAAEQLMAAQRRDPGDPANARFETRLRLAVQQTGRPAAASAVPTPMIAPGELDDLVRTLPAGTVEHFTNTIQPLLINRCGAGNCHGSGAPSEFQLVYPHAGGKLPRRFTQLNLKAATELLDRDQPDRSPLLVMASVVHGGTDEPPLMADDIEPLQHLAEWVFRATQSGQQRAPAAVKRPDALLLQPMDPRRPLAAAPPPSTPGGTPTASPQAALDAPASAARPAGHDARPPAKPLTEQNGVDPFDPEVFNRRYLEQPDPVATKRSG